MPPIPRPATTAEMLKPRLKKIVPTDQRMILMIGKSPLMVLPESSGSLENREIFFQRMADDGGKGADAVEEIRMMPMTRIALSALGCSLRFCVDRKNAVVERGTTFLLNRVIRKSSRSVSVFAAIF